MQNPKCKRRNKMGPMFWRRSVSRDTTGANSPNMKISVWRHNHRFVFFLVVIRPAIARIVSVYIFGSRWTRKAQAGELNEAKNDRNGKSVHLFRPSLGMWTQFELCSIYLASFASFSRFICSLYFMRVTQLLNMKLSEYGSAFDVVSTARRAIVRKIPKTKLKLYAKPRMANKCKSC